MRTVLAAIFCLILLPMVSGIPPALAGDDERSPSFETLDLEGIPKAKIDHPTKLLEAGVLEDARGRKGWIVRLRSIPKIKNQRSPHNVLGLFPSPAIDFGRVIVGGGLTSCALYAFDARTGRRLWTTHLNDNGPSTVAVSSGRAIVNTESCTTYGIDVATGRRAWSRVLGPSVHAAPSIHGDRVLAAFLGNGGRFALKSMSLKSGKGLWNHALPADLIGAPIWAGNRIYMTCQNGTVTCVAATNGRTVWTRRVGAASAPWLDRNAVFVSLRSSSGGQAPNVLRIDAEDGKSEWWSEHATTRRTRDMVSTTKPARRAWAVAFSGWGFDPPRPVVIGERCIIAGGAEMRVFDRENGREFLRALLPAHQSFHAPPAVLGRNLLFVTAQGMLIEIDSLTGSIRRALDVGIPMSSQPVVKDGRVFIAAGGFVMAIPWGEHDGPDWPQWGGGAARTGVETVSMRRVR
jgi:Ca-activated chloride channel homolog